MNSNKTSQDDNSQLICLLCSFSLKDSHSFQQFLAHGSFSSHSLSLLLLRGCLCCWTRFEISGGGSRKPLTLHLLLIRSSRFHQVWLRAQQLKHRSGELWVNFRTFRFLGHGLFASAHSLAMTASRSQRHGVLVDMISLSRDMRR